MFKLLRLLGFEGAESLKTKYNTHDDAHDGKCPQNSMHLFTAHSVLAQCLGWVSGTNKTTRDSDKLNPAAETPEFDVVNWMAISTPSNNTAFTHT